LLRLFFVLINFLFFPAGSTSLAVSPEMDMTDGADILSLYRMF